MNTSYRLQPEQFEYLHDILSYISSDKNRYTLKMSQLVYRHYTYVLEKILNERGYDTDYQKFLNHDMRDLHLRIIESKSKLYSMGTTAEINVRSKDDWRHERISYQGRIPILR